MADNVEKIDFFHYLVYEAIGTAAIHGLLRK
jgi:hypothetical protein